MLNPRQIPLGIAYLAASIKDYCDLEIFDMQVDDGLLEKIQCNQPDIIGFSVFSVDFLYTKKLIEIAKKLSPKSLIVAGGAHATVEPVETLQAGADLVIRGEGDDAILAVVNSLNTNQLKQSKIPSTSYFDTNYVGGVCHNPASREKNIDHFPLPAMEIFDLAKYDQYPLLTSRGCPYGCKFCASKTIWGQKVRFHSADRVFKEITRAVEDYSYKHLVFVDDTFTLQHSRLFDLCDRIIASGYDITWAVNSRTDTINEAVADKISQAGCQVVSFGIETGSELLRRKPINNQATRSSHRGQTV